MARQKNMQRRRNILRNTFTLLRKNGINNVSLQMIADKSEISKSLLQSYYPHKNKLIIEIVTNFMSTILQILNSDKFQNVNTYAKMKAFIYILLEMGLRDEGISNVLESILKDPDSTEKWGQILDNWLIDEGVKDDLGNDMQLKPGLAFIVSGGANLFLKRQQFEVKAEKISDIMVKTFMTTFLDFPDERVNETLKEGHELIEKFEIDEVFHAVDIMFS
ncbi:AcrR family transcriptional regulator [Lactobacillus colini]|uniref:AcrR family transcriptional regulator n=1 Tax=Lactobacillus colini TaxID=1819254 RepID=A0ABS4MDP6_9LACO|nr:TetR/AcrR family transcriptional regulator [Lactobacillus colini]MBP2057466.1 AcrR family transcriptional regulator [Lactobacillus colini]